MSFTPKQRFFDVEPSLWVAAPSGWGSPPVPEAPRRPDFADDENLKKLYGIELAKNEDTFAAAIVLFPQNTGNALWASRNWVIDPVVIASRDIYKQKVDAEGLMLDKTQLAAKLLKFEQEKHPNNPRVYLHESKDRLAALKLYAEVQGWIGKAADIQVNNSFTNNEMKIRFVEAEKKEIKTIQQSTINVENDEPSPHAMPIKLKFIG